MTGLLTKVKSKMRKLNVPFQYAELSKKPDKKIMVRINDKSIYFGDKNSQSYIEGASEEKRNAYIARHSKILLQDGTRAIDRKYSPAWLSYWILWN